MTLEGIVHKSGTSAVVDDDVAKAFIEQRIAHEFIARPLGAVEATRACGLLQKRRFRCRLVRVLKESGATGEIQKQEMKILARRSFVYAGLRYRRGDQLHVSPEAAEFFILSKKAQQMEQD